MNQLIGILIIGLGAIGFVASLVCTIAIWLFRRRLKRISKESLQTLETVLKVVDEKLGQSHEAVALVKGLVGPATRSILLLAQTGQRTNPEGERELAKTEEELGRRLQQVELFVPFCQAAVTVANKTARLARSLPLGWLAFPTLELPFGDLHNTSATLADLSGRLRRLGATLATIRETHQAKADSVALVIGLSGEIDPLMATLQGQLERVRQRISTFPAEAAHIQGKLRFWVRAGALIASGVLLWIGLGQLMLVLRGFELWQGP